MNTGKPSNSEEQSYSVDASRAGGVYTGDGGTQHNHFYASSGLDQDETAKLVEHVAQALKSRPVGSPAPLPGWVRVTRQFLATRKPRADLADFFDGLAPDWKDICHPELRPRPALMKIVQAFQPDDLEDRSILVRIGGATGDGKSTILLQAVVLLAQEDRFDTIFWRSTADARLTPDVVAAMRECQRTVLIASDDAEALLADIDSYEKMKLHEEEVFVHFLLASRDVDWNAERDRLGWKGSVADRWAASFRVSSPIQVGVVDPADALVVAQNWVHCSSSRPARLATGDIRSIAREMVNASRASEGRQAFMGGVLSMRFDSERLRSRLSSLLSRLATMHSGEPGISLAEFIVALGAVDISGIEGVPRDVAARFLGIAESDLRPLVEVPMKREFFLSTSSREFFARHPSISKALVELSLGDEYGVRVESSLQKLIGDVQYIGRSNGFRGGFGKLKDLGRRLAFSGVSHDLIGELALNLCRTACVVAPCDLSSFMALSQVLREQQQPEASLREVWEDTTARLDDVTQWSDYAEYTRSSWCELATALGTCKKWWPAFWAAQVSISDRPQNKLDPHQVVVSLSLISLNAMRTYEHASNQDDISILLTEVAALTSQIGSAFYDEYRYPTRCLEELGITPREFGGAEALRSALLRASRGLKATQPSLSWCARAVDPRDDSLVKLTNLVSRLAK